MGGSAGEGEFAEELGFGESVSLGRRRGEWNSIRKVIFEWNSIQKIQSLMMIRKVIIAQITIGIIYFLNHMDNLRFFAPFRNY